jgi:eukaryotic-like serine/threonine-protein kinase
MPLTSGSKLGPYEIQSSLGSGGMGEVYRARDTRLDRAVAIKVLASHLPSSPELKQRMEREARAISSLNHPHVCHLYDIGSQNDLITWLWNFWKAKPWRCDCRKESCLCQRCTESASDWRTPSRWRIAKAHRDLKPGNVRLTKSGIKLMDFGLAKPLSVHTPAASSASPPPSFTAAATLSGPSALSPLTTAGSIVGTIQYMSPEQIEGKEADARSDIFALGAVMYEMAAGRRPFEGKSQISVASAILEKDPEPISSIEPQVPTAFEHLLTTCLQKNPEDRFQAAHDVKLQLEWIAAQKSAPPATLASQAGSRSKERFVWGAAVAILFAALAAALFYRPRLTGRQIRASLNAPDKTTLDLTGDFAGPPVLSPDGASVAFSATDSAGKTALWVRPLNSSEAHVVPDTDGGIFPFRSLDSRSLGFFAASKLKTIDINSSSAQVIADAPFGRGGSWSRGGVIIFASNTQVPLKRISSSVGVSANAGTIDVTQHTSHRWPFFLPDGKHFLYLAISHDSS